MELGNLTDWYKTVAGIAVAAVAAGYGVRAMVGDTAGFLSRVPLVLYTLISCVVLSAIAKYVMGVEFVEAATFAQLLVVAGTACIVAVGGVGFVTNVAKPLAATVSDARKMGGKFAVLLGLGLAASLTVACGARQMQPIVTAENSVHLAMSKVDDRLDAECDAGNFQPAFCKAANAPLAKMWAAKNLINRQLRNGITLDKIGSDVAAFQTAVKELIAEFRKLGDAGKDLIGTLLPLEGNASALFWGE